MNIHRLDECEEFTAGDRTLLRELWNPHHHAEFSGRYSLAHATLPPGASSLPHTLATHELYYILSGSGVMHIEGESTVVDAGAAIEIPPGARQWIENTGGEPLRFLCIVDPAWRPEDETVDNR